MHSTPSERLKPRLYPSLEGNDYPRDGVSLGVIGVIGYDCHNANIEECILI